MEGSHPRSPPALVVNLQGVVVREACWGCEVEVEVAGTILFCSSVDGLVLVLGRGRGRYLLWVGRGDGLTF